MSYPYEGLSAMNNRIITDFAKSRGFDIRVDFNPMRLQFDVSLKRFDCDYVINTGLHDMDDAYHVLDIVNYVIDDYERYVDSDKYVIDMFKGGHKYDLEKFNRIVKESPELVV